MSFGVRGADFQPMGHAHIVTNMVDYGMGIQQAIDAPRVFYVGEITEVERGVPGACSCRTKVARAQRHAS